jgi:cyclopropane-fatty-acyl-phospholipid synthase
MPLAQRAPLPRRRSWVSSRARRTIHDLVARADIRIDGNRPFDLKIRDDAFYDAVMRGGLTGARDAYVEGWWDTDQLDELTHRLLRSDAELPYANALQLWLERLAGQLLNRQAGRRGLEVSRHYDLGNDLFEAMLDPAMNYSCGYWRTADSLAEAQQAKLDLVCKKLGLRPGMRVLEIGCGWGGFARVAAERYGAEVVGITISQQQLEYGQRVCRGLPVELRLQDYRTLDGRERFDAVASIGMFEHVGYKNYRRYLRLVRRCLEPHGLFLLHTIGGLRSETSYDTWMDRNVFPNAMLPSLRQIASACEGLFVVEDLHNFGADYDRTLMAWFANFERAWPRLRAAYDERFFRIWKCYLLTNAGAFRARMHQTWQLVLSGAGVPGGYQTVR